MNGLRGYSYSMPWNIKREGSVLDIHITVPVGDWELLFDAVQDRLGNGLVAAAVPEHLPGAPLIDRDILQRLRQALTDSGLELLEPDPALI
jgi:hypothetical protein